jgi:thiamine biosynthesis lipoprotein
VRLAERTATAPSARAIALANQIPVARDAQHWSGRFLAFDGPCEVLIEDAPQSLAREIVQVVAGCARRIERKFGRARTDNVIHRINTSEGRPVLVDDETADLLDFAATLTRLSSGGIDITAGILYKAWATDDTGHAPSQAEIDALLPFVGWHRATWTRPELTLPAGMQIDLGSIVREYAVDASARLAAAMAPGVSCLVNFGGEVAVRTSRRDRARWCVGVECAATLGCASSVLPFARGGLATSGRQPPIDARTGFPVVDAPHSVTVATDTCTQAVTLTMLAMLEGPRAQDFLRSTGRQYWVQ